MPARGRVAGPVPWIHWRARSGGMSAPSNRPARASATVSDVPGIESPGEAKAMGDPVRARSSRRCARCVITSRRASSSGASASRAASAWGVTTSS